MLRRAGEPEVRDQDKDNVSRPQGTLSDRSSGLHAEAAGEGGPSSFLPRFLLHSQPQGRDQSCKSSLRFVEVFEF